MASLPRPSFPRIASLAVLLSGAASALCAQPYYPNMLYGVKQPIAPGVTWRTAEHATPKWSAQIIEIDMTSPSVALIPVHKQTGALERTSAMAERVHAVAAINAGFFNTKPPYESVSATFIDGRLVSAGGAGRSALGFGGKNQSKAACSKLDAAGAPSSRSEWNGVLDAIAGRGRFTAFEGVVKSVDVEGQSSSHDTARHPRTAIGYSRRPYRVFLVTVDGRQPGHSVGMNYTEMARLMADAGADVSVCLDGGGSTTTWVKGKVVNKPSDGNERRVVSAWAVVPAVTVDNRDPEIAWGGAWTPERHPEKYDEDQFIARGSKELAWFSWKPALKQDGVYKVQAWWTDDHARSAAVPYQIKHAGGQAAVLADQRTKGGQWNTLGSYRFAAGGDGLVMLSNTTPGTVSADAVRFVRVGD